MKGFILAAGFGQRMLPITETLPKPLLPIAGTPLIVYSIRLLAKAGITDIIINVHHLAKTIMAALGDGAQFGVNITYSQESEILGTGGGLKRMHEALDETFVVINSDILVDVDLTALLAQHHARGAQATMVLREPDAAQAHVGRIGIDRAERVVQVLDQGALPESSPWPVQRSLMFTGVHILEPHFLDYIPHNVHSDIIRYGYMKALRNGAPLWATVTHGYWADAGTPQTYLTANCDMLAEPRRFAHIAPMDHYSLRPKRPVAEVVCMGDAVHLGDRSRPIPPVLLGENTRIGDDSQVGPWTVVGNNVTIGRGAQVSHSMVLDDAKVPSGAVVQHMLVGPHGSLALGPGDSTP
jgi:NDP-sugar pyrophosphorylase family protein